MFPAAQTNLLQYKNLQRRIKVATFFYFVFPYKTEEKDLYSSINSYSRQPDKISFEHNKNKYFRRAKNHMTQMPEYQYVVLKAVLSFIKINSCNGLTIGRSIKRAQIY